MSAGVTIRELGPEDWPTWRRLRLAALAEAPYAFGSRLSDWQGEGDREERWRDRLAMPGSHSVIAMLGDEPVGMATGAPAGERGVVEVISMWVAPEARGRGVGDALLHEVERWARTRGAPTIGLCVADGNPAAVRLYERNGYAFTRELGDLMADGVRRERVMAKPLEGSPGSRQARPPG